MNAKRTAYVTGAGKGIGRAVALRLASHGYRVGLGSRTKSDLETLVAEIRRKGAEAAFAVLDVTNPESVEKAFGELQKQLGPADALVNNAGSAKSAPFLKTGLDLWSELLALNLTGAFLCTRAALPGMLERGWGRIVNMASTAALTGGSYIAAYAASKHGVLGLTRSVAAEVAGKGVTVNAVCPGYVDTPLTERNVQHIADKTGRSAKEARAQLESLNPQGRFLTPEEVAHAVLFLCAEEAGGINGQAIVLDGGRLAQS